MVRGHGFSSPSSPDADDPPTGLSEVPCDVPWREEGELCGRIGAVLQVLADALVELPLQSQHAGHGVERSELVLLERPDCVECERSLSRREEVAVQEVQDEPTFGADVCLKTTKKCEVVRGGPPTQRMVQAQNRVESGPRRQSRKRVAGRGGEVEALDDGIGNSLGCRGDPHLVRIDGSDLESGFREPNRPSADPARHIEEVRPGCDAFPLEEHPNRLDVLQWRPNDPRGHSSPPDDDLGRAVDRGRAHLESAEPLRRMPSAADQLPVLLEDPDVRLFVVVPERRPEVEGRVEWRVGRRHRFREPPEISDVVRRAVGHALLAREFGRARDEHRGQVDARSPVAHLREARRMPSDAARHIEDSAARRDAKPPQDHAQVARLLLARGPGVLVDREEHFRMAEEQIFGPVSGGHRLAMFLALFGGVAGPLDASLRLLERLHDSFRVLPADSCSQSSDIGCTVDFVVRFGSDFRQRRVGRHENEDDLRRVLPQESGEASNGGAPCRANRLDEEQDRTAVRDDRRFILRRAPAGIGHPEPEGAMFVWQLLAVHLPADGRLEVRPAGVAGAAGHRPAPSIASTTARAKAEVRTSLAPGMRRARSYVTTFEPTTDLTAERRRTAASRQPTYSSIITPASISAVGLTLSIPAYFGALPWTGSNSAWASPMFPPAATPSPPI